MKTVLSILALTSLMSCRSLTSVETKMGLCKNICNDKVLKYESLTDDCYCQTK